MFRRLVRRMRGGLFRSAPDREPAGEAVVGEDAVDRAGKQVAEGPKSVTRATGKSSDDGEMPAPELPPEPDVELGVPEDGEECEVVIGLDFGTSSTKVVMRTPDLPGEHAVPVDFGELGDNDNTHLLPTRLWIGKDGSCSLRSMEGAEAVDSIKVKLMGEKAASDAGTANAESIAVAYLALVLARARLWFADEQRDIVGHFTSFRWSVNLGVPSPHVGDNEQNRRFARVGAAAWMVTEARNETEAPDIDTVALDEATACLRLAHSMADRNAVDTELTCELAIVPEIVGASVGYARSKRRNDGLHLLIDVGASTMDVASVLLTRRRGDDKYALCTADVHMLGVREYERARHQVRSSCDKELRRVVQILLNDKAPRELVWRPGHGLPVLLIGGGSKIAFYQERVRALGVAIRRDFRVPNDGVTRIRLPIPKSVRRNREEFHRLTVAWGLSYPAWDIGDVVSADRVGDVEPIIRSVKPMLSKDEM